MKTLIVILVFFLTTTQYAKNLEYKVLSDEETKLLLEIYLSANDIWYGVYNEVKLNQNDL